ncbi:hypothetical protein GCM10027097_71470 [Amycolatopsis acidiphila]
MVWGELDGRALLRVSLLVGGALALAASGGVRRRPFHGLLDRRPADSAPCHIGTGSAAVIPPASR